MKAHVVAFGFAAFGLALAPPAGAQEFGKAHGFVIAAERVMGFTSTKTETEGSIETGALSTDYESETTHSHFDFLAKGDVSDPFVAPRLAFDFFVIDGLSVGGALGYSSDDRDGDETIGNTNRDVVAEESSGVIVAPRVGYAVMFTPVVGIWPRGGLSYWTSKQELDQPGNQPDTEANASGLSLSAEVMLVIAPVPHGAFLVGPTLDLPVTSSGDADLGGNTNADFDKVDVTTLGIQAGVGVWF